MEYAHPMLDELGLAEKHAQAKKQMEETIGKPRVSREKLRLIDHVDCGGIGCRGCKMTGTEMAETYRPDMTMPADADAFFAAREACPCYEGVSINMDVSQCRHTDADGEWCEVETCPLVRPNALAQADAACGVSPGAMGSTIGGE